MLVLPNTTTYNASFLPLIKRRQGETVRLPTIIPVRFATNFLSDDYRVKKAPVLSQRLRDARRSISLGLGMPRVFQTIHWSIDKPIVRSLRPQDIPTVLPPPAEDECAGPKVAKSDSSESVQSDNEEEKEIDWDELANKRRYTSVTAAAAEERALYLPPPPPKTILSSTCETDCDPVHNQVSWTEWKLPRPISITWDRAHTRFMDGITAVKTKGSLSRIPSQSQSEASVTVKTSQSVSKIFYRSDPIPGYTGYQPRLPIITNPDHVIVTIAKSSYKKLSLHEYTPPHYPHQSPFSKMISLIPPHNAFNRIKAVEPLKL